MSVTFEKGSMKNADKDGDGKNDHLVLEMVNRAGTGSVTIDLKVFVDGVDMSKSATLTIAGQTPQQVGPSMYVYSTYGDRVLVEIKHDGKIGPGRHKVRYDAKVGWQSYSHEIEDTVE